MKKIFFLSLAFCTFLIVQACVEKRPAPPAQPRAQVNHSPRPAAVRGAAAPTGNFVKMANPLAEVMRNLQITNDQTKQLFELRRPYMDRMVANKNPDGTFSNDRVMAIMKEQNAAIQQFLEPKYKRYQAYMRWKNTQGAAQ